MPPFTLNLHKSFFNASLFKMGHASHRNSGLFRRSRSWSLAWTSRYSRETSLSTYLKFSLNIRNLCQFRAQNARMVPVRMQPVSRTGSTNETILQAVAENLPALPSRTADPSGGHAVRGIEQDRILRKFPLTARMVRFKKLLAPFISTGCINPLQCIAVLSLKTQG